MWELDCEEGRAPKNWCFWAVVLEKTLKSPLDCKEIQPIHSEWDQPRDFFGRNDAEAETAVLWPPHVKNWLIGKDSDAGRDWGQEEKGTTEDQTAGWHHWLDGRESEWTPGVGDGQGDLACCDSWCHKELDTTEWLNWTELNWWHYVNLKNHSNCCLMASPCGLSWWISLLQGSDWVVPRKFILEEISVVFCLLMILLDEILSHGLLIIPALMLSIDLSFLLGSFKLKQSDKPSLNKKKKLTYHLLKGKLSQL